MINKEGYKIESRDTAKKNLGYYEVTHMNQEVSLLVWKIRPHEREIENHDTTEEDPESNKSLTCKPGASPSSIEV
jgi:hypothetical protein